MLRIDHLEAEADATTLLPAWDELAWACRLPYGTYKSRFTGEAEQLEWLTIIPVRSFGSARVWAGVVPEFVTRGAINRRSPANKERLKSLTGRSKESSA